MKSFHYRQSISIFILIVFCCSRIYSQQGIHGAKTIATANNVVNEYTALTQNAFFGNTSLTVANSALNTNARFTTTLQPGDLIMIIQLQGIDIKNGNDLGGIGSDTAWGRIENYYYCGNYEFRQVLSVPNATTINLDCPLSKDYLSTAFSPSTKSQVIRVPRYSSLTVNSGGVLTCDDWNGTIGGILAVEVQGNTVVNAGGIIDATGKGFRGAALAANTPNTGSNTVFSTLNTTAADKGEGIVGYQTIYDNEGGRYGRGAAANAGGGGCVHNAGGGGGANASPNPSLWKGFGIPDLSTAAWTGAWNLDNPNFSTFNVTNSAGGGRGGYSFSSSNQNATITGPSNSAWGGDNRNKDATGLGGRALDYSTGKLFLGGGGGAGHQNNSAGGAGGDGGGLIYLMVYGNISGSGTIQSNGLNGGNAQGGSAFPTGMDGAGGAGAGGTIVLNSVGGVANTITCNANGGTGGNQVISVTNGNEAEGPGGGGGGGYIAVSSGTPTRNSNGGNNGVTNSGALTEFTPNGATKGCPGINNATITFFTISATNTAVCGSGSVTLTATLGGNPPVGTITWYNASIGGTQLGTGSTFTTPVLSATTTYWVGICPGTYRSPVTVTVNPLPTVSITTPNSICVSAASFNLTATPAGGTWSGTGITNATNGTFSPSTAGTGTFTITYSYTDANGCTNTDTDQQIVTANPSPASINTVSPLCANSSPVTLSSTPSGGVWSGTGITNTSTGTFSPATSGTGTFVVTYSVAGSCPTSATQTITVSAQPTVTVASQTICPGTSVTLGASGATTYSWNTGATTASITVTPTVTTNYTVTGTSNSCTASATATVTVNSVATVSVNTVSPLCANSPTLTLSATPGGGTWSGTGITNTSTGVFSPSVSGVGTFTITYNVSGACTGSDQEVVTVNAVPNSSITPVSAVCSNANAFNLSAATPGGVWSGTGITNTSIGTFSPSTAGTGSFVVTYSIGGTCPSSSTTTVTVNAAPTVSVNSPTVCAGNSVTLNAIGATTYSWNTGANLPSITVTPTVSTNYTVTGTSGSCTASAVSNVSVTPVTSVSITPVSALCTNGSSITLSANVAGGTWSGTGIVNSSTGTFDPANSGAGTFTVSYQSPGTCPGTDQEIVTVNVPPNTSITPVAPLCSNDSPLNLTAASPGGVWTGNGIMSSAFGTFDPSISGAGNIVVTYSISGGCSSSSNYTLTVNQAPQVTVTSQTICPGGAATLTASGASTYLWDNGSLNPSIIVTPTVTSTYTVSGTANGCIDTAISTVTVNPPPIININPVSALCANSASISLISNVTGGVWSGTGITDVVNGTFDPSVSGAGSFVITYNISGACGGTDSETINVNALPVIAAGSNSPVCVNLSLSLTSNTINGAVYSWSGPNGFISPLEDPIIANAQINASGSYTLSVSNNGCSSTAIVTATINPIPTANAGNDAFICQGNSVVLNGSGVGSYLWTPSLGLSSDTISGPTALPNITTLYVLTVDAGGCTDSDSVLVTVSPSPVLNVTNDTTVCLGQCVNLNVTGADYYTWNSSPGLNNLSDSTHLVCPNISTTYTVTGYITSTNSVYNGDFSLGNNGFYSSYTYSSNTQPEGTYYVSTNANFTHPGFTGLDHTTGTGNFLIVNGSGTPNSSVWCQTITVQPNTDYVFSCWVSALALGSPAILQFNINGVQLGNTFQAPLNTGVWSQFFTTWNSGSSTTAVICIINQNTTLGGNDFGLDDIFFSSVCNTTKTISVNVNQPQDPTIIQAGPFCSGDTALQLSSASAGGVWGGTGVDTLGYFNPLQTGAGTFTVSYTYNGVCPAQDTMVVSVIQSSDASITQNNTTFCVNGGTTSLTSLQSGGVWSGTGITNPTTGAFDPATVGIGTYDIIYTLGGNCGDQDTVQITVANSFDATINQAQSLCSGGTTITLSAASPGGVWTGQGITNGGLGVFDPAVSGAGNFIITYSISGVCGATDTTTILVNPSADASILTNISSLCSNQNAVTLTTAQSGGVWSGTGISSGGIFNPSSSGTGNFQLIYTINGPCGDADTTNINVNAAPSASASSSSISGCAPFCTAFSSGNGNSWLWNFSDGTTDNSQNPNHCFNTPGVYSVSVVVSNANCADTGYVTITANNVAVANFGTNPQGIISPGTTVSFANNSTGANNYLWNFGVASTNNDTSSFNSPNYLYADTGTYCITLVAYGDGGCNDTAVNCIIVMDEASIEIPNIFTPNGDGSNDFFFIKTVGVKDLTCIIYDRWGLKVAEFSGVNGKWYGTMSNGNTASNGTYFYIVDYETIQGKTGTAKGYVQLIGNN